MKTTDDVDDLLSEAIVRLKSEIAAIDRQVEQLDKIRQFKAGKLTRILNAQGFDTEPPAPLEELNLDDSSVSQAIRAVARDLTTRHGRPVRRTEILDALRASGIVVGGKQPAKTITRVMTRAKDEFVHEGDGYVLKEAPIAGD
ncbi:hypothetical protein GOA99_18780 [Sinorhizobium meliloti]|nr:hypothetical protein [Sinorhizobium meliloti]